MDARQWRAAEAAQRRVPAATPTRCAASRPHEVHPVEDFLFTYYTLKPGQFKRWHPGAGIILLDAPERTSWRFYRHATEQELLDAGCTPQVARAQADAASAVTVDVTDFVERRATALAFTHEILRNTAAKKGQFGCFGMHEWAMAYKSVENNIRHGYLELRLGAEGTDRVVEEHRIRCSHFDAFRFFMPQAAPLNELQPTRETQRVLEQPACLHANMDVYKWAYKLLPLVDSTLVMDCFDLAWDARELDMRAPPTIFATGGTSRFQWRRPRARLNTYAFSVSCRSVPLGYVSACLRCASAIFRPSRRKRRDSSLLEYPPTERYTPVTVR